MEGHDPMACAIKHMVDMMARGKAKKYLGDDDEEGEGVLPEGHPPTSEAHKNYPDRMANDHNNSLEDSPKTEAKDQRRPTLFALLGKMKKKR